MSTTLLTDTVLQNGRYRILDILGQGGFGITYLGMQSGLERHVAIKEFYMKDFCDRNVDSSRVTIGTESARSMVLRFREKFVSEARKLARLNHPNIVRVIDVFEENDTAYYVMEYAEGGSLSTKVKSEGALPVHDAIRYSFEVASALTYIHERSMNHLDIKPGNIMLNEKGETVVIDFGMSKQYDTATGNATSTTPVGISDGYAPMEQYRAGGVSEFTPQTDIYALGATLFFLLTGQRPPSAADVNEEGLPADAFRAHSVPESVIAVVSKAMEPRKKDRYATAQAFSDALKVAEASPLDDSDEVTVIEVGKPATDVRNEAERKEAERKARKEAERKAREEAERKAREEAERKAREITANEKSETKSGMGKLLLGLGVTAIFAAFVLFNTRGCKGQKSSYEESDTVSIAAIPDSVQNAMINLNHGHETKRNFIYTGHVDAYGIPDGTGFGEYPELPDCPSCHFDGAYVNGIPSDGILTFSNGDVYKGTFNDYGFYAEGKLITAKGTAYEGSYKDGQPYNGKWYDAQGKLTSEVVNGKKKEEPKPVQKKKKSSSKSSDEGLKTSEQPKPEPKHRQSDF